MGAKVVPSYTNTCMDQGSYVPPQILSTSPVFTQSDGRGLLALPLNLVVDIISYLHDPADLARVVLTCRLLHYMTLPVLYSDVSLHAFPDIRFSRGKPRGYGSASPFVRGLNTLVTRNMGPLVRKFSLSGHFKEYDVEEYARAGRVPDHSFMLNTLVRAAIDKMQNLDGFSWTLNIHITQSIYEGLAARPGLTSLEIKFSSSRVPYPAFVIPALPDLVNLKVTNLDPLCFNDDISLLLLHATKLKYLTLAWSARLPKELDSSVDLHTHFGRLAKNKVKLKLRGLVMKNLYARLSMDLQDAIDFAIIEEATSLERHARGANDLSYVFLEQSWSSAMPRDLPMVKFVRLDSTSKHTMALFRRMKDIERIYFVDPTFARETGESAETSPFSNGSRRATPMSTDVADGGDTDQSTKQDFLELIAKKSGLSMRHLLLPITWNLTEDEVQFVTKSCPNLEQFAFRTTPDFKRKIDSVVGPLKNLKIVRLLTDPHSQTPSGMPSSNAAESMSEDESAFSEQFGMKIMEGVMTKAQATSLEWLELNKNYYRIRWADATALETRNGNPDLPRKASIKPASWEDVKNIDIWRLDSYDI